MVPECVIALPGYLLLVKRPLANLLSSLIFCLLKMYIDAGSA
jgi:hypothetical protein